MRIGRRRTVVPEELTGEIDEALVAVDAATAELNKATYDTASRETRRDAHAELGRAFERADALLRRATQIAGEHSHRERSKWRARLSQLDTARQVHLFAEQDDPGVALLGNVRAVDTGMTAPRLGELQHGESKPPGTPATYGLDVDGDHDGRRRTWHEVPQRPRTTRTPRDRVA